MSAAATAERAPDAIDRFAERVADRANPIVVKEVRQGLRTRVFWIFFVLMLAACLVISLVAFGTASEAGTIAGKGAFIGYFVCLACVQFFVIPYTAYRSMSREAEEETWVLLTLTGLGPRRILAGKVTSSVLQGMLYASAAAPFLLFSYYLNGIDLFTIMSSLAVSVAYQVFLVSIAVSTATLASSRIVRGLLHFVLLGGLLQALGLGLGGTMGALELAQRLHSKGLFWLVASATFFGTASTGLLWFELAAARLSLVTEDYARGPRLWFLAQAVGIVVFFLWGALSSGELETLAVGSVVSAVHALFVGHMVASDTDGMARVHWATGRRFSLLKPGALRGFVLVVLVVLGATAAYVGGLTTGAVDPDVLMVTLAAPAFALVYFAAPQIVSRWLPHTPSQTPLMVRVIAFGLLVLGLGAPPLVGEVISKPDDPVLNLLNPVLGVVNIKGNEHGWTPVIVVWAVGLGLLAWAFATLRGRDVEPLA